MMKLRVGYLTLYNVAIAGAVAVSVMFAVTAHHRAAARAHWKQDAVTWQARADAKQKADDLAVARVKALSDRYTALAKTVQKDQKALAALITKTRTMKRKVVTGATIVSYASSGGGPTPSG
jgi:inactivated superfamily I helicase